MTDPVVPNTPDSQGSLPLWPAQDPNLHRLGIYDFEIEPNKLHQCVTNADLPKKGAPFLTLELSGSKLKCIAQTKDSSLCIAAPAPLHKRAEIGAERVR